MKKILIFSIIISLMAGLTTSVESRDRNQVRQDQFNHIVELIENGDFIFEARRAYPQSGRSVDLTTNYGFIEISDEIGKAHLPYFGRAYNVPYGGRGGIIFSGEIENIELSKNADKLRVNYSFEVRDKDYYQVSMNIGYNGDASVVITSTSRGRISYQGYISETSGS
jgi:hypothetical protein